MHCFTLNEKQSKQALARKRSASSLSTITASDERPRNEKSEPYIRAAYERLLETRGKVYLHESEHGISKESKKLCQDLLDRKYATPVDTIFDDDVFEEACHGLRNRNEARVVQDIARLLVPSAETLALKSNKRYKPLVESVNEGWNNCITITSIRPQPDYAVGFKFSAFPKAVSKKLANAIYNDDVLSPFMGTAYLHFPFLTSETKCGASALDIADRQNAHSMGVAVKGIVQLFQLAEREKDLDGEVLTFSVSHDHRAVRIYGYYPVIVGQDVSVYRHEIYDFSFVTAGGRERWTTRNFTMAVYDYSLSLFDRILSVIDDLPDDFVFKIRSDVPSTVHSGLSQSLAAQTLQPEDTLSRSDLEDVQPITPETSSQSAETSKKQKV
ncbi:MAG: hypothetical protein Q9163_002926 [Psora crenata]